MDVQPIIRERERGKRRVRGREGEEEKLLQP
jgi:hypothetical protein